MGNTFSISGAITANNLPYGQVHIFGPYPIPYFEVFFTITDDEHGCILSTFLAPPSCSNENNCQISASLVSVECQTNSTPIDLNDDTWSFIADIDGINAGNTWEVLIGGIQYVGNYNDNFELSNLPLTGSETVSYEIRAANNSNCFTTITVSYTHLTLPTTSRV